MRVRPTSVTVIAWLLIVVGTIKLPWTLIFWHDSATKELMARNSSLPISVQYFDIYAGLVISMVTGIGMLKGHNWARILYVACLLIDMILLFATCPMRPIVIFAPVVPLIIIFFLFRPNANRYFRADRTP
jgi:hypothetical protein